MNQHGIMAKTRNQHTQCSSDRVGSGFQVTSELMVTVRQQVLDDLCTHNNNNKTTITSR
jgi:hypothetical protein